MDARVWQQCIMVGSALINNKGEAVFVCLYTFCMFTIGYSWRATFDGQILAHMTHVSTLWFVSCDIPDGSRVVSRLFKINLLGYTMYTPKSTGAGLITESLVITTHETDTEEKRHTTPQKMKTQVCLHKKKLRQSKTDLGLGTSFLISLVQVGKEKIWEYSGQSVTFSTDSNLSKNKRKERHPPAPSKNENIMKVMVCR